MATLRLINSVPKRCFSSSQVNITEGATTGSVLPALGKQVTSRIISGEHEPSLQKNIVLSSSNHGWSHLELTKDHVRIEFDSINKEYQDSAAMYFESEEELEERGIPRCFKPVKLENKVAIGGGATIYLDREELASFLRLYSNDNTSKIEPTFMHK